MKKLLLLVVFVLAGCSTNNVITLREQVLAAQACAQLGTNLVDAVSYQSFSLQQRTIHMKCDGGVEIKFTYSTTRPEPKVDV